jgi:hypothetical protein
MDERGLKNNYIFTFVKCILFVILFCFLVELTRDFWREMGSRERFDLRMLVFSVLFCFAFYTFCVDLNDVYKKIQNFFFRSTFFSLVFPSLLIVLGLAYLLLPKIFSLPFNRDIFIFSGGFAFTVHLIFTARETKGYSFSAFIHYLFIFSILYMLNLMLLGLYFSIAFKVHVGRIVLSGAKDGAILLQNIFTRALK